MNRQLVSFALPAVILVSLCVWTPAGVRPQESDGQELSLAAELVSVPVVPRDEKGRIVTDLKAEEFAVFDEGESQGIEFFQRDTAPLDVLLLLDTSASTGATLDVIRESAAVFVKQLKKGDSFAVMTFTEQPKLIQPWTGDPKAAQAALGSIAASGNTYLYQSAIVAMRSMFASRPKTNRRALVILTDGLDINAGFYTSKRTGDAALARDVTVYVVSVNRIADQTITQMLAEREMSDDLRRGYLDMQQYLREVEAPLGDLAGVTGGRVVFPVRNQDLSKAYEQIAEELRSRYLLAFYVPETAKDGFRKISVTVRRPGVSVRARSGYFKGPFVDVARP